MTNDSSNKAYRLGDLVDEVMRRTQADRKQTEAIIKATLGAIREQVQAGNKIAIQDFGTFQLTQRNERQGTNPATREKMTIPARKAILFRPASGWSNAVAGLSPTTGKS
jgi:DNA-binding protein HU-beta